MLLVLKILLAIASYVFICFTKKHMWARILSICTGVSWILWMIIPSISSEEIPKMSALWQSIFWVTAFISVYMVVCVIFAGCHEDDNRCKGLFRVSFIVFIISTVLTCITAIMYLKIHFNTYESNIEYEQKVETNVISSVTLAAPNANSELYETLTTKQIIKYWYYASDGSINPGSVPRKSIKIFFIEDDETPHMDTVVKTTQLIEINYNEMIKTPYGKKEVARTYVFYIPKGSMLE